MKVSRDSTQVPNPLAAVCLTASGTPAPSTTRCRFEPEAMPNLSGIRVFVAAGELDHMAPKENTERLIELLRDSGAEVEVRWQRTGHGLGREEVEEAKR